jgi:hypothetical protein
MCHEQPIIIKEATIFFHFLIAVLNCSWGYNWGEKTLRCTKNQLCKVHFGSFFEFIFKYKKLDKNTKTLKWC